MQVCLNLQTASSNTRLTPECPQLRSQSFGRAKKTMFSSFVWWPYINLVMELCTLTALHLAEEKHCCWSCRYSTASGRHLRSQWLCFTAAKGWELFHLVASTMPPSKDYVGLVSEYVHTVSHNDAEEANVRAMALKTWNSLKRSAKAGPRKTVSLSASSQ